MKVKVKFPVEIEVDDEVFENAVEKSIMDNPNIAVVIRCKDCKHRKETACFHPCGGMWVGVVLKDDDFCSYGERKENAQRDL